MAAFDISNGSNDVISSSYGTRSQQLQQPRLTLIGEGSSVRALGQQVLVSVLEGS